MLRTVQVILSVGEGEGREERGGRRGKGGEGREERGGRRGEGGEGGEGREERGGEGRDKRGRRGWEEGVEDGMRRKRKQSSLGVHISMMSHTLKLLLPGKQSSVICCRALCPQTADG